MRTAKLRTVEKTRQQMGPRTVDGKRRALEARLRGKLPHSAMIVPGIETAEEWAEFRNSVVTEFAPEGPIESELADRIAHQMWRLRRFARYEADRAAWRMKCAPVEYHRFREALTSGLYGHDVPQPLPAPPFEPPFRHSGPAEVQCDAVWYASPEAAATPAADEHESGASALVRAAASAAGLSGYKVPNKDEGWTVGEVRRHLAAIATLGHITEAELLSAVAAKAEEDEAMRVADLTRRRAPYDAALDDFKRTLTLPTESEIRNAARWESHLERSLCRMMDRLERIQRMRSGEFVQAPALVEVSVDRQ